MERRGDRWDGGRNGWIAMNERGKDEERVWRLCETVMDANEPYIHASNFGCVCHFGIYMQVSVLIKLSALLAINSVCFYLRRQRGKMVMGKKYPSSGFLDIRYLSLQMLPENAVRMQFHFFV